MPTRRAPASAQPRTAGRRLVEERLLRHGVGEDGRQLLAGQVGHAVEQVDVDDGDGGLAAGSAGERAGQAERPTVGAGRPGYDLDAHMAPLLYNIPKEKIQIMLDRGLVTCVRLRNAMQNGQVDDILNQDEKKIILSNVAKICKENE